MGKLLHIRLASPALRTPVLLEVESAELVHGEALADVLARRWPNLHWYWSSLALTELEQLPREGRILLTDAPMAPTRMPVPSNIQGGAPVLVVLRGPDPGGSLRLRRGLYALGRGNVDLSIGDLGLSRRHALVRVDDTSIVLSDESSANGVWFAQRPILERRLLVGDVFSAGNSIFAVLPARGLPAVAGAWPPEPIVIGAEEPGSRLGLLLVGALAPLGLGVGLFLMTHSVFFLAFSAISLLTGGLPALAMLGAKKRFRRAWAEASAADAARREELAPPVGAVAAGLAACVSVDSSGFPALVPGRGTLAAWLSTGSGASAPRPKQNRGHASLFWRGHGLRQVAASSVAGIATAGDPEPGVVAHVPVALVLRPGHGVWFRGSESDWGPVLRAAIVRWLPLLAAGSLRLAIRGPAAFLPAECAMFKGVVLLPSDGFPSVSITPTIVLSVSSFAGLGCHSEATDASLAACAWLYCGGPDPGARAEALIDSGAQLLELRAGGDKNNPWARGPAPTQGRARPRSTSQSEQANDPQPSGTRPRPGSGAQRPDPARELDGAEHRLRLETEGIGFDVFAHAVNGVLPVEVPAPTVINHPSAVTGVLAPNIVNNVQHLETVIGDTEDGVLHLDLDADGPHILVAGTTGSGKSELLRSLVLGLAAATGPDELAFMLVDFKGGATLAPLRELPHVQNFVSDLDAAAGERILELLGHELHRREEFLSRHGATDHLDYRRSRTATDPPLPRLVVLIDEFRVFATELPEALERVVRVATVGRSLGIHLVLSTQRPAGTISAALRANLGSVIALRTIGDFESNDLIGSAEAAGLDPGVPGAALFRRGGGPTVKFRARVNARPSVRPRVRGFGHDLVGELFSEELLFTGSGHTTAPAGGDRELAMEVQSIVALHLNVEPAQNPFSPALPALLNSIPRSVIRRVPPSHGVLGLLDRPADPRPEGLVFDPSSTPRLLVCGLPGSGIESVPELLLNAVNRPSLRLPAMLLDGNGTLGALRRHRAVGGYFGPGDGWRINELLLQLADPGCVEPLVLVVCGLGGWAQVLEANLFMRLEAQLAGFARTAPQLGRALVVCGDRDLTGSRAASLCESRWYLPRGAGPEVLMGWPPLRKVSALVGRGVLIAPGEPARGVEFQLGDGTLLPAPPAGPVPENWLYSLPLPDQLACVQQPVSWVAVSGAPALALGVCGPDNRVFVWNPGACGIIVGRPGSAKSTLMGHLATLGAPEKCHTVHLGPQDALPTEAGAFLAQHPRVARVLVERADLRTAVAARAIEILLAASLQVILSAEPSPRLLFELGLSSVVRDQRSFLVLDPQFGADAEPSGFRLPNATCSVPGRAIVFDRGTMRQIQCVNRTP